MLILVDVALHHPHPRGEAPQASDQYVDATPLLIHMLLLLLLVLLLLVHWGGKRIGGELNNGRETLASLDLLTIIVWKRKCQRENS